MDWFFCKFCFEMKQALNAEFKRMRCCELCAIKNNFPLPRIADCESCGGAIYREEDGLLCISCHKENRKNAYYGWDED